MPGKKDLVVMSRRDAGKEGSCREGSASRRSVSSRVWRGASDAIECSACRRERIGSRVEIIGGSSERVIDKDKAPQNEVLSIGKALDVTWIKLSAGRRGNDVMC